MEKAYQKTIEEIYEELNTSSKGLSNIEANERRRKYGLNTLIDKNKKT